MPSEHATVGFMHSGNKVADEEYLSSGDVMAIVRISRRTLERYVASGKLPAMRLPSGHRRYLRRDVNALLTPPAAPADSAPDAESVGALSRSHAA